MTKRIDDELLLAVLEGRANPETEKLVEEAVQKESDVRARIEQLSGSNHWPLGSAPVIPITVSESLHTAILRLEQDWDQVLSAYVGKSNTTPRANTELGSSEIPSLKIVKEIGRGGMGVVYEGFDEALGRRVAIKQLHPQYHQDSHRLERLQREAKAIASLNHPHVLAVYGFQTVDGYPCLIHQLVDGESLQAIIDRDGAIPFPQCSQLALQIAQGLAAAHAAGIVHRDLKPDNVLVEHRTQIARLGDFGLAKRLGDDNFTQEGFVAGTPRFMAPEQAESKVVDHRSDLFSLGALLYTMASGQPPFDGKDPYVVLDAIRNRPHASLVSLFPHIPKWYSHLVDRLLEKDVQQRVQSIDEVVQTIEQRKLDDSTRQLFWLTKAIMIASLPLILLVTGLAWYFTANRPGSTSPESNDLRTTEIIPLPTIVTTSNGKSFRGLEEAVADAVDGETIVISDDIVLSKIDIEGKRIQIIAAQGTSPIIRSSNNNNELSGAFIRSDSDLTLKGLRFENQATPTGPWVEDGKLVAGIYIGEGRRLVIEDCHIRRTGGGVCIGVAGQLEMRHSWIEGSDVAIAWYALDTDCLIENSLLQAKIGVGTVYPPANVKPMRTSTFTIRQSSLLTEAVVELLLTRFPSSTPNFIFDRCVLDAKHAVSLRTTPIFSADLMTAQAMIDAYHRSLVWSNNGCVFATRMDYLIARRLRTPNRKNSAEIHSLEMWNQQSPNPGLPDKSIMIPSIERDVITTLPTVEDANLRNFQSGLHRFSPELPSDWLEEKSLPGI